MSVEAITWAYAQPVERSSDMFVLVTLANWANENWEAYPSVLGIASKTKLDRKTVLAALARLVECGFMEDTGERKGSTKQIAVYKLNSTKNGTLKESQKRNSPKNGTVPKLPDNKPKNGTLKESQKRDTDTKENLYTKEILNIKTVAHPLTDGDAPSKKKSAAPNPKNQQAWAAYEQAYFARYKVHPVRNAKVNGQIAQLVQRIGEDAHHVAAWYVGHRGQWYTQKAHSVDALLKDCEALRTQWATGQQITTRRAQDMDRSVIGSVSHLLDDEPF